MERTVQVIVVLVSAGLGALLFFEPNVFLRIVGEGAEVMSWRLFIASEITLMTLLIAAVWPYIDEG